MNIRSSVALLLAFLFVGSQAQIRLRPTFPSPSPTPISVLTQDCEDSLAIDIIEIGLLDAQITQCDQCLTTYDDLIKQALQYREVNKTLTEQCFAALNITCPQAVAEVIGSLASDSAQVRQEALMARVQKMQKKTLAAVKARANQRGEAGLPSAPSVLESCLAQRLHNKKYMSSRRHWLSICTTRCAEEQDIYELLIFWSLWFAESLATCKAAPSQPPCAAV